MKRREFLKHTAATASPVGVFPADPKSMRPALQPALKLTPLCPAEIEEKQRRGPAAPPLFRDPRQGQAVVTTAEGAVCAT